ncbi:MAG: dockerin type I repeat-containing protein, partial [candidate division Zixibacteria bacterium]|nr:dockerin type I repeat-containing protein [candidate division Zixibacteria bacterium]
FTTPDSAIGLTVDYWTTPGNFISFPGGTWEVVIMRVMYWNNTALPIDSVFCAYAFDWDVPSDTDTHNAYAIAPGVSPTYVYQRGIDYGVDTGNAACRDNFTRYAATIYTPPSSAGEDVYSDGGNGTMGVSFQSLCRHFSSDFIDTDWDHPSLDSILHHDNGFCIPFGMPPPVFGDRFTLFNGGAYRIDPDDTLALWLRVLTGFGTQEEFDNAAANAISSVNVHCCSSGGDANFDGSVNIADVTFLIARIFAGGPPPPCCESASANGDATVNISDVTFLIARIFAGGLAPVCGPDGMGC